MINIGIFFFKQKTAYEMRISDWSSDVCSSDLANVQAPAGIFIMEDPPIHTAHRGALSRIFTPKNMSMLEPKIRDFCARSLDPLIDSGQLDFVADLGAKMPMRVIGMLLGIPEDRKSVV